MMPEPPVNLHPSSVDVVHLICSCQLGAAPPLSLCALDLADVVLVDEDAELAPCVVSLELGTYAFAAGRCERCPREVSS